jgi:general secretion pathway protein L
MPDKIIGLDIGSYSIKALALKPKFRGGEVLDFWEKRIVPLQPEYSAPPADQAAAGEFFDDPADKTRVNAGALAAAGEKTAGAAATEDGEVVPSRLLSPEVMAILAEGDYKNAQLIVALPYNLVSSKIVSFPFKDKKKIDQVISYSVEGQIPIDIEDMVVDYQIISKTPKESQVVVNLAKREVIREFLEQLKEVGIDPHVVEFNASALFNLVPLLFKDSRECTALIDIGHDKTSLCIFKDQKLAILRTISLGGKFITENLASDLELDLDDAEAAKEEFGTLSGDDITREKGKTSSPAARATLSIKESVDVLLQELQRTFHVLQVEQKLEVTQLFLAGGTAKLKNIGQYFSEQLKLPVELLQTVNGYLTLTGMQEDPDSMAGSLGLALRGALPKRNSQVNFRREEFLHHEEESELKKSVRLIVILSVIVIGLYFTSLFSHYSYLQGRLNASEEELYRAFSQLLDGVAFKKQNFQQNKAIFETKKKELEKKAKILTGGVGIDITPLEIMRVISEKIPKEIKIDIDELDINIEGKKVMIKGTTDTFTSVERVDKGLKEYPLFRDVSSKPERDKKEESISVKYTIMLGQDKEEGDKNGKNE